MDFSQHTWMAYLLYYCYGFHPTYIRGPKVHNSSAHAQLKMSSACEKEAKETMHSGCLLGKSQGKCLARVRYTWRNKFTL